MLKTFHESPFLDKFEKKEHGKPKVSIILPARNEEKFIEKCLDSLIKQDYDNYEIITINDSSNDTTGDIIKKYSEKFPKVIGLSITSEEIKKILSSLGCFIRMSGKKMKVLPPTWRPDIKEDIDLIEELTRIKGYDKVPLINPEKENVKDTLNYKQKLFHFVQRSVASKGFIEAVTWSFTDSKTDALFSELKNEIKLSNPISSDLDVLRSSLYSNLIISAKKYS